MLTLSTAALLAALEAEYLGVEAQSRWPVLMFIMTFDVICYCFRICAKCTTLYWRTGEQHRRRCTGQHQVIAAGACPATTISTASLIMLPCHLFLPPPGEGLSSSLMVVARDMGPQCASMIVLYTLIGLLNRRSKRLGDTAARQVGGGWGGMQGVASIPVSVGAFTTGRVGQTFEFWPPAATQGFLHPQFAVSPSLNPPRTQSAVC